MNKLHGVAFILLIIGGLNWLLTVFGYGVGQYLSETVANVVYVVIGLAAVYEIATHKKNCKECSAGTGM